MISCPFLPHSAISWLNKKSWMWGQGKRGKPGESGQIKKNLSQEKSDHWQERGLWNSDHCKAHPFSLSNGAFDCPCEENERNWAWNKSDHWQERGLWNSDHCKAHPFSLSNGAFDCPCEENKRNWAWNKSDHWQERGLWNSDHCKAHPFSLSNCAFDCQCEESGINRKNESLFSQVWCEREFIEPYCTVFETIWFLVGSLRKPKPSSRV